MNIKYTIVSRPNVNRCSEDAAAVVQDIGGLFFAAIADGHGLEIDKDGNTLVKSATVARFAQDIVTSVREQCERAPDPSRLVEYFDTAARSLEAVYRPLMPDRHKVACACVGAVASTILVTDSDMHLAQTGDCRLYAASAVQPEGFLQLSDDHDGDNPIEKERLKPFLDSGDFCLNVDTGYWVFFTPSNVPRLFRREGLRSYVGGLAPTRVFGDWQYLPAVTHTPECRSIELSKFAFGELFALCSDGGNKIVEATFKHFRGQTTFVPLEEVADVARTLLPGAQDDVTIIFFRQKT